MKAIEKIARAIKKYGSFLITSHVNPEGDALGSQLAMAKLLEGLGKEFAIIDHDRVPGHYQFLPQVDLIRQKNHPEGGSFDAALVLDCPSLTRTGRVKNTAKKTACVINIDHHVSNENFGNLNWVEKNTSSTGEMVYKLYKKMNRRITKETALYLYIAILTDTGSFNYSNTSSATHEIVSELLGYGIEPYDVSRSIYGNKTYADIKLLAGCLSDLKLTSGGRIAYMVVRRALFRKTGTKPYACENFINFARSIRGVGVAVFFREDIKRKDMFHVSFRSTRGVDVNKIASSFGGGGHKSASGCTMRGSFEEVKRKVLKRVNDRLKRRHNPD
ncbi:MAG: bifunctional oligoribonuclease/PAP phosphatase NrnA [Candidatus Omnitrophota bacterium]